MRCTGRIIGLIRLITVLVCVVGTLTGCASPHDGQLLWEFEIKKSYLQWGVVDAQRLYLCADDVYCLDIATGRLNWEFKSFGTHASAPVLDAGRLYFQCGGLYALDAVTGNVLWEFWTNDWATAAPAAGAGRVYAPVGDMLYCLDAAGGKRLWSLRTGALKKAPIVNGDRLIINAGGTVHCLDAASGKALWQLGAEQVPGPLAAGGHYMYAGDAEGHLHAYSAATGAEMWRFNTNADFFPSVTAVPNGDVLVSAGASLHYFQAGSGMPLWTFKSDQQGMLGLPRVIGSHMYVRDSRKQLHCLLLQDGSYVGRMNLPDGVRVLTDGTVALFFPGVQGRNSRTVKCFSMSAH